jgi:putative ABC transport system permease protein
MVIGFSIQSIYKRKFRTFLAIASIAIGTCSLLVFMGLNKGIQTATFQKMEKQSPLTQITVRPPIEEAGIISFITRPEGTKIDRTHIEQISKIRGVKNVYPETQFNNFASIQANLLGQTLITDAMIFGVPKGFIETDTKNPEIWDRKEEPYPAIIPRKILEIYNIGVASPQNLPTLSEDILIGRTLTLYPNYSTFFPTNNRTDQKIQLKVVGFSDKVSLIGATLPFEVVEELNQKYTNNPETKILELFVETSDESLTSSVAKEIEDLGFNTFYLQKDFQNIEMRFNYLRNSLGAISAIILITCGIAIMSTFLATISERIKELALFRALGATKTHIKKLILLEAGMTGLVGSLLGVIIGIPTGNIINNYGLQGLDKTIFQVNTMFIIDYKTIATTILFGVVLSIISAYIPAHKAANIKPIEALNR